MESKFLIPASYPFSIIHIAAVRIMTGGVNIYLCGCASLLAPEYAVSHCVSVT